MEINEKAINLLGERICDTCRFCVNFHKFTTKLSIGGDVFDPGLVCDYDNIMIYRPKGMEFAMNKFVDENTTCEKWEKNSK